MSVVTTPTLWNQHQIDEMFELCDLLEVPLRFQGPVAPRDNGDRTPLAIQPSESTWDYITEILDRRQNVDAGGQQPDDIKQSVTEITPEQPATCGVGVAGVDIDPFGNVNACMHLQESAGNIHDQSIEEIWNNSPLFTKARNRAVNAAKRFSVDPPKQLGAPLFCLAVEENLQKGNCGHCQAACK